MVKFGNKNFISAHILGKKFTCPIVTHAVPNQKIFFDILDDNMVKIPSDRKFEGTHQYMNKYFNIHNCVYFSAGWEYNTTYHHWPLAFIFKTTILKEKSFETFKTFIISQAWMNILRYWRDHDPEYLTKLSKSSKNAKEQIGIFLKKDACSFWVFEKDLGTFLQNYGHKQKIFEMLNEFRYKNKLRNKYAPAYVKRHYFEDEYSHRIEIVSHKSVSLNSEMFLGLYIDKPILNKILPKLTKYFDKNIIIFDGRKKHYLFDLVH